MKESAILKKLEFCLIQVVKEVIEGLRVPLRI